MKSHPSTVVVAPSQIAAQLRNALADNRQALSQIRIAPLKQGQITTHEEGGVQVGSLSLSHGNVENAAYLVVLNGKQVLHIGDTDLPMTGLAQLGLSHRRIDVAFVPFGNLQKILKRSQSNWRPSRDPDARDYQPYD